MVNPKISFPAKKLPSYLKGLLDSRARADGDVQRLTPAVTAAQAALARAAATLERHEARLNRAQEARDACDTLLRKWSDAVDVDNIASVQAWKGRYGERGALRQQILALLKSAGAEGASTGVLADQLTAIFGLAFLTRRARTLWIRDTVSSALKALTEKGLIEKGTRAEIGPMRKPWRLVSSTPDALDTLSQQAAMAGLAIKTGSNTGTRPK